MGNKSLLQLILSPRIVQNALRVAMVVGTILNLINQGGSILAGTGISWFHLLLNYLVPYCVASYSAAQNQLTRTSNEPGLFSSPKSTSFPPARERRR
jgi:magnesium-transporting ATPase (P-type)